MNKNVYKYSRPNGYIPGIDGLRGIGIIAVVLYHLFPQTVKGGFLGVPIFFILSGYLIVKSSQRSYDRGDFHLISFYKRRISRIYPVLLAVVVLTLAFMTLFASDMLGGIRSEVASVVFGYNNWWQIAQSSSYFQRLDSSSPFTHLWFLAIELQFYLIWPLFFMLYKKSGTKKDEQKAIFATGALILLSWGLMAFLYTPGEDPSRVYYGTDTRLFSILLGSFAAMIEGDSSQMKQISSSEETIHIILSLILTAGMVVSFWVVDGTDPWTYYVILFLSSVAALFLLLAITNPQLPVANWFGFAPLVWLGKYSYEIYLTHYPIVLFYQRLITTEQTFFHVTIQLILTLIVSVLIRTFTTKNKDLGVLGKIVKELSAIVAVALIIVTVYGLATAPSSGLTEDQLQLQQELEANQELLERQAQQVKEKPKAPQPPPEQTPPDDSLASFDTDDTPEEKPAIAPPTSVTAVGDSVMLGGAQELIEIMPDIVVDAKESRQVKDTVEILQNLDSQGLLGETVVIALGSNGEFTLEAADAILEYLGDSRNVYWVTVFGESISWADDVNATINQVAADHPNVTIIDWADDADDHPDWFYDDGIHLNGTGRKEYANFIAQSIGLEV